MKKTLFILSLFFAAQSAFSGNNAGFSLKVAQSAEGLNKVNTLIPVPFSLILDQNYLLSGTAIKTGLNAYSYIGVITNGSQLVGTVTGYFQVEIENGVESVIEDSVFGVCSDGDVAELLKTKHNEVKNAIQNVR